MNGFIMAMQARGLKPPPHIEPGRLYRTASSDKAGDTAGWCKLFPDGRGGVFGDWRAGWQETWQAKRDRPMSAAEREAWQRQVAEASQQREAEDCARHETAAQEAARLWEAASEAPASHAYLKARGIQPHGLRIRNGALVAPVRNGSELLSLQFIDDDGGKRFLPAGRVAGGYYSIGKPDSVLCICEGFATGASIHEATGYAVAVAFNAGNLLTVARAMRKQFPALRLILCADDDARTQGNPGLTKAREAAQAVGGFLAVPDFGSNRPQGGTDFNDLMRHTGAEAVCRCIESATPAQDGSSAGEVASCAILTRADSITPEAVSWLWDGWLAAGKLHILAGAPSAGKTSIALSMAATASTGGRWPDGTQAGCGSVVMWSGEDDPADTLVPRLVAMGADSSRVHFVSAVPGPDGKRLPFDPARDVEALSNAIAKLPDVRLLIVDPIVSAVAGDSHHNAETRRSLQPLVDLAATHRCALVGITHLSKGTTGRDPVERVTGSLAFGALARVVMLAAKQSAESEQPERRLLLRAKSNIGPDSGGHVYDLRQVELSGHTGLIASSVLWGAAVEGSARELLAEAEERPDDGATDAAGFLRELLADGPRPAKEVIAEARDAGYSNDAMQRARRKIGAQTHKRGMTGGWSWSLPAAEGSEDGAFQRVPSSPSSGDWPPSSEAIEL